MQFIVVGEWISNSVPSLSDYHSVSIDEVFFRYTLSAAVELLCYQSRAEYGNCTVATALKKHHLTQDWVWEV